MPRRFTDARQLLDDLLDRFEGGTASPIAYPDYQGFGSVPATDRFLKEIARMEAAGAVSTRRGSGALRDQVVHVRLIAPEILYGLLGRVPAPLAAQDAGARLLDGLGLHQGLAEAAAGVAAIWARAKTWAGLGVEDVEKVRSALLLAQAILDDRHVEVDYRTFSRRVTGDSKALERVEGAVVRLLVGLRDLPPGAKPREALRTLGLERFAPPLLIAGRVDLEGADLSGPSLAYLGLSPKQAGLIRFREPPAYLLTIENFASFNRHVLEADPDRLGTTMYVGGYPSLGTQQALRTLADAAPKGTPIFHWSDIDPDGTWIFHTIERAIGQPVRPHLMSIEIAEAHGKIPTSKAPPARCPASSGIFPLVEYLLKDDAKTLEQEGLEPVLPRL